MWYLVGLPLQELWGYVENYSAIVTLLNSEIDDQADKDVTRAISSIFESLRSEDEFKKIWKKIKVFAEENNIYLQTPLTGK